jgi:hypothetical protein
MSTEREPEYHTALQNNTLLTFSVTDERLHILDDADFSDQLLLTNVKDELSNAAILEVYPSDEWTWLVDLVQPGCKDSEVTWLSTINNEVMKKLRDAKDDDYYAMKSGLIRTRTLTDNLLYEIRETAVKYNEELLESILKSRPNSCTIEIYPMKASSQIWKIRFVNCKQAIWLADVYYEKALYLIKKY